MMYKRIMINLVGIIYIINAIILYILLIMKFFTFSNSNFILLGILDLIGFSIGYFFLKYPNKTREIMFLEFLNQTKKPS